MRWVFFLCFVINFGLTMWAISIGLDLFSIALFLLSGGLCLVAYLRDDV